MKESVKPTMILAAVTLCAGMLLAGVYTLTFDQIEQLKKETENSALSRVLPGYEIVEKKELPGSKGSWYWIAENGDSTGYAFITEGPGYSGTLRVMVGIDEDFIIQGISILAQTETPGLGARCTEISSKNTFFDVITGNAVPEGDVRPWFQQQFDKLDGMKEIFIVKKGDWNQSMASELQTKNEISAISGATITTKSVRDCISAGLENFKSVVK